RDWSSAVCSSDLHDGFPVGVSHVGDENVAGLDFIHFGGIRHNAHLAGTNLLTDGTAGDQDFTGSLQAVTLLNIIGALLRFDRFRAGLQDIDLAVDTVTVPLGVHPAAILLLDNDRINF